jgi:inorganic triphosphatase YgiF
MLEVELAAHAKQTTEVELKLALDPTAVESAARLPSLLRPGVDGPTTRALRSIYFDTSDADLRRLHLTLRLRRAEDAWWQALKQEDATGAGLHVRAKSEHPVESEGLDLEKIEDSGLRRKLLKWQTAGELIPRFETVVNRTTWLLGTAAGGVIECALDLGEVRTLDGRSVAPLCEVELELKSGPVSELFTLARELGESLPLALEHRSKAARGYALWRREPQSNADKAGLPALGVDETAARAMTQIVINGIAHLQHNWQAAVNATRYNPEHVHQMRVATRRLRTAFSVFGQLDESLKAHPIVGELRWLAASLGEARDWDVLLAETFSKVSVAFPDEGSLVDLARGAQLRRRRARGQVREALRSARYFALVLNLSEFIVRLHEYPTLAVPVVPVAARILTRRHKQLRKRARHLATLSATERHALRIAAKKLRYTAEFFASLFAGSKLDRFLRHFGRLQKALGALNDLDTMRALMNDLAEGANADMQRALALCTGWSTGLEEGRIPELAPCWKSVRRTPRFWPDHREMMDTPRTEALPTAEKIEPDAAVETAEETKV